MVSIISITKEQFTNISKSCVPLNIISLISSVISCVTFGFIQMYYPNLADRVSFRLTFAALFCDIGYSSHLLIVLSWNNTPGFLCGYTIWAIVFFGLSSLFFIVCIALNLHIIFINEYKSRYNFEKYYFIISFTFALILSILPVIGNMYGFDEPEESCWYRDSGQEHNIIWQWITLFGWIDASILYCAIIVIMVIIKLRSVTKNVDDVFASFPTSQLSGYPALINKNVISSVVRRVVWYPVVPLIAQFCNSFVETYAYVNRVVYYPLFLLCYVGMSLQGLLNALVFSQDIAVTRAFQAVKLHWWISNVNTYESLYPHRSHNKAIIDDFGSILGKSNNFIELKAINYSKADIIRSDEDLINEEIFNDNIINNDITNNVINNIPINNRVNNNNNNNDNNDDNSVSQPSLLEWLRYIILIKLFSTPKLSPQLISLELLSPINSFNGNKPNTYSAPFGKNDSKQNITPFDNQNGDQGSSRNNQTNQTNQTNLKNINNPMDITIGDEEVQIDVIHNDVQTKRLSEDLSDKIEAFKLILKRL
ncbi:hypothetical protein F8M41_023985 [Gigaspora margarita]|uniref:G-protein coupled receptors family 2 profile 2 domain-containing protein n=2 Tax=Gigaspora margarita TaxID=4874 RepID=A0A8H4B518_GIGMA|nr:hypothetical protein F8M41_023985 [Gigaspora margarita]